MRIKINCYDKKWNFKKRITNIKNIESIEFSEMYNGWQGNFALELDEKFDSFFYEKWDFIEYIIFDEENKKWLHKFSWFINWIERYFSIKDWQWLKLEIQGLVALLSEEKIEKSYNWNLYDCLNNFINDVNEIFILEWKMEFLWEKIFKNAIKNIEEAKKINVSITGENYFDILQKIFLWQEKSVNNRHFFVNQSWEIIFLEEIEKTNIFTINKDISEININNNWEIIINLINPTKKLQVWQKIILQNINKNLNLNWKFIRELAFWLSKVVINVWKVVNLWNLK